MTTMHTSVDESAVALSAIIQHSGIKGGSILWVRGGEKRLIPAAVIQNAFNLAAAWQEVVRAGILEYIPAEARFIHWDSTLSIPELPPRVSVVIPEDHLPQE